MKNCGDTGGGKGDDRRGWNWEGNAEGAQLLR